MRILPRCFPPKISAILSLLIFFTATLVLGGVTVPRAIASEVEAAGGVYDDDVASAFISSQAVSFQTDSIFSGKGRKSAFKLGLTEKQVTYKDDTSLFVREELDGEPTMNELSITASYDQGIAVGTRVGISTGTTNSKLGNSQFVGVRAGQWWFRETLETTIDVRRTTADQKPSTGTDLDGERIVLPENLEGYNLNLGVTSFVTTTTILTGSFSYTTRSDRPAAQGISGELRQYITPTKSAWYLGASHYQNVGALDPVTFTGSIVANSVYTEWHQRMLSRMILMGGYRYYLETETPRAEGFDDKELGSDSFYTTLRYRDSEVAWTQDASEVYLFASTYHTSAPQNGTLIGLGGKFVW